MMSTYDDFQDQVVRATPNTMRMETDPAILNAIEAISGTGTVKHLMQRYLDMANKQKPKTVKPYERIIRTLVEYGADINKLNSNGRYPLDMAIETDDNDLIQLVSCLGAYKRAVL